MRRGALLKFPVPRNMGSMGGERAPHPYMYPPWKVMHPEIAWRLNFVWARQPIWWIPCIPTGSVSRVSSWRHLENGHLPCWYWVWNTLQNCVLHSEVPCLLSEEYCAPQACKPKHNYDPLVRSWLIVQGCPCDPTALQSLATGQKWSQRCSFTVQSLLHFLQCLEKQHFLLFSFNA